MLEDCISFWCSANFYVQLSFNSLAMQLNRFILLNLQHTTLVLPIYSYLIGFAAAYT
jgi:hypothetical protein